MTFALTAGRVCVQHWDEPVQVDDVVGILIDLREALRLLCFPPPFDGFYPKPAFPVPAQMRARDRPRERPVTSIVRIVHQRSADEEEA